MRSWLTILACGGAIGVLWAFGMPAAHGDPDGEKLIRMQTLAGGSTFFIDSNSIQNSNGALQFGVLGFSGTDPDPSGGYTKSSASIDCRQGVYQASFASTTVDEDGSSNSNGLHGNAAPITLRNDGKELYNSMRDLCKKYSGLDADAMSSW